MADTTKAKKVREYIAKHPHATSQEVAQAVTTPAFEIGARYVSQIKSRGGAAKAKKAKRRPTSKTKSVRKTGAKPTARRGRPYPAKTLEESLAISRAIREKNNGNPWDTEDVAQASLGVARSNNKFFYTAAAARDYGLTVGTRDTEKIELAPLGREIFFAGDEETKKRKMLEAFFGIDIFKRVFEHYGSADLPKKEFLTNTLQKEFGLDPEWHDDFVKTFKANCEFLGIDKGLGPQQTIPKKDESLEHPSEIQVLGQPKGKLTEPPL